MINTKKASNNPKPKSKKALCKCSVVSTISDSRNKRKKNIMEEPKIYSIF